MLGDGVRVHGDVRIFVAVTRKVDFQVPFGAKSVPAYVALKGTFTFKEERVRGVFEVRE